MPNTEPIITVRNLTCAYGPEPVLKDVAFDVAPGEVFVVIGRSGCGKSTLLKHMIGLIKPVSGSIFFDGGLVDDAALRSGHLLRRKAVLLGQDTCLLKRSVAANVAYGLKLRGQPAPRQRIAQALALVGLDFAQYGGRPWMRLSGGEARRVALAARLILDPLALLLDEPTTGLDRASTEHVKRAVLSARANHGATLVIVSHDMAWLSSCADRVLTLEEGRIIGGL